MPVEMSKGVFVRICVYVRCLCMYVCISVLFTFKRRLLFVCFRDKILELVERDQDFDIVDREETCLTMHFTVEPILVDLTF